MFTRSLRSKVAWAGVATVVTAAMLAPVGLAGKPTTKPNDNKPIAAEKTWVKIGGGTGYGTYLKLDAGFQSAVASLAPTPLKPAGAAGDKGIRFPITQGKLVLKFDKSASPKVNEVRGTIGHVGGLSFTKGTTVVRVRNLVIVADTTGTSKLTAQVNGKRIDFASLKFTSFPTIAGQKVSVSGVEVRLSADAVAALNAAFGTSLAANTLVGTASVEARLVGKGKA
jgi:hypothetical protein